MSRIITDHKWKNFLTRNEIPKKILEDQFDWTNENDHFDNFLKYKNTYYHLSEFLRTNDPEWDGQTHISNTCGILIKVSNDGEQYMIATVIC